MPKKKIYHALKEAYGKVNLSTIPAFQGGYINFGYWKNIEILFLKKITLFQRIQASKNLYKIIFDCMNLKNTDKILELGCGQGYGCVDLYRSLTPNKIIGVDIVAEQIQRAQQIHKTSLLQTGSLNFINASADQLPFNQNSFTKIFSVEAAHCFDSFQNIAKELLKILSPGGIFGIAAPFSKDECSWKHLKKILPPIKRGSDLSLPIEHLREEFQKAGFKETSFKSIGQYVFPMMEQWINQIEDVEWAHNYYFGFVNNLIDYYIMTWEK